MSNYLFDNVPSEILSIVLFYLNNTQDIFNFNKAVKLNSIDDPQMWETKFVSNFPRVYSNNIKSVYRHNYHIASQDNKLNKILINYNIFDNAYSQAKYLMLYPLECYILEFPFVSISSLEILSLNSELINKLLDLQFKYGSIDIVGNIKQSVNKITLIIIIEYIGENNLMVKDNTEISLSYEQYFNILFDLALRNKKFTFLPRLK